MKIGIVGAGQMGTALIRGFMRAGQHSPSAVTLLVKNPPNPRVDRLQAELGFALTSDDTVFAKAGLDAVILTTPAPLTKAIVAKLVDQGLSASTLLLSAAAGVTVAALHDIAPNYPVITFIPNIPVAVNQGTITLAKDAETDPVQLAQAKQLFALLGTVVVVKASQLNIAGTLSGCGPAFVDIFMAAMSDAAVAAGLDRPTAQQLIASMVAGSGQLAANSQQSFSDLAGLVTSPGGTTIQGVLALEAHQFRHAIIQAVLAANR